MTFFEKNHIIEDSLTGWQNFIKYRIPTTNNALESLNKNIKETVTNYLKLNFGDFIQKIWQFVKERSFNSFEKEFPRQPVIPDSIKHIGLYLSEAFEEKFYRSEELNIFYILDKEITFCYFVNGKIYKKLRKFIDNPENKAKILEKFEKPTID